MAKRINEREALFIAYYQTSHNATESAVKAGYSPKSAKSIGCQLLKKPKISLAIKDQTAKQLAEISKESFINRALSIHDELDKTEPNAPRYYDIAGKALGYIGVNQDSRPNQTLIINATLTGKESPQELLANVRRLIQQDAQP